MPLALGFALFSGAAAIVHEANGTTSEESHVLKSLEAFGPRRPVQHRYIVTSIGLRCCCPDRLSGLERLRKLRASGSPPGSAGSL